MRREKVLFGVVVVLLMALMVQVQVFAGEPLSFEERVKAQEAIERVYYNKRIWPKENPQPKPAFEKMVPKETIQAKAEDIVLKNYALEETWGRPITSEQLQAEMDRFVKKTKDPEGLKELFTALDNDPQVIAEVLARQTLSDRLIRTWYAWDPRFHQETKKLADEVGRSPENYMSGERANISVTRTRFDLTTGKSLENREELASVPGNEEMPEFEVPEHIRTSLRCEKQAEPMIMPTQEEDFYIVSRYEKESDGTGIAYSIKVDKKPFVEWWGEKKKELSLQEALTKIRTESTVTYTLQRTEAYVPLSPDAWRNIDGPPSDRSRHTAVWTGEEMIIWGGNNGVYLKTGGRYNPTTDSWQTVSLKGAPPSARAFHTAIWTGQRMLVWGGYNGIYLSDGAIYDPISDSWIAISDSSCPSARRQHTAVWNGTQMLVWGGESATNTYLSNGGIYNPEINTWITMPMDGVPPSARTRHVAVWTGKEMIVWGGYNGAYLGDGSKFSSTAQVWTSCTSLNAPEARADHTAVWTGERILIWGGCSSSGNLNTGSAYLPNTDTWSPINSGTAPSSRRNHSAIWTGEEMVIWGGGESSETSLTGLRSGGRYRLSTDSWITIDDSNAPLGRRLHTAIWTGSEMVIWGGTQSYENYSLASGGRWSPGTNTWVGTYVGNQERRYKPAGVWTGIEYILWGGIYGYHNYFADGLKTGYNYLPSTDIWLPTSTGANVPQERYYHTAVWTGSKMIVWGGSPPNQTVLNTGGCYDPSVDEWVSTSTNGPAPEARLGHSAVWSGDGMIVWGGRNNAQALNTGSKYDPINDIWIMIAETNAPTPRYIHSAVWTGSEMIVWGGMNYGGIVFNTGGRYSLLDNRWEPLPLDSNTPTARMDHLSFITSQGMFVWGGWSNVSGTEAANTGGLFSSVDNTWSAVSVVGCPEPRAQLSGVWTGLEAIVWGGGDYGNIKYGNGGRYDLIHSSWRQIEASSYSPEARLSAPSAWTGSGMIILGGEPCGTGGIFYPNTPPRAVGDIVNSYNSQPDTLALGSADPLQLNGSASTNGSNPGSVPAYSDAFDSIVEYAWDINGDVVLDANGEITSGTFDRFTANVTIPQSNLGIFGLNTPGDKTITFRVTDELGVKSWQTFTLHVVDINPPVAVITSPNGGETWPYSASETLRSQRLIVWTVSDNLGLKRLRVSYTTKPSPAEPDWVCIADTQAGCGTLALTDASYMWSLPTLAEATASGQLFPSATARVRIEAWDNSDNLTVDTSDSSFYIIQPTTTAIETLIVTNTDRIAEAGAVYSKLTELASHNKVNGVILDLKNVSSLSDPATGLYKQWDDDPTNVGKANAVADGIRDYIVGQVNGAYTSAKYLVLVGGDSVLPSRRMLDGAATYPENGYATQVDCTSPVGAAICQNYYLTDNTFGDLEYDTTNTGANFLAIPDLATGRLVETPEEIMATINSFISQDGQMDLKRALVTGYDFLEDSAAHIRNAYQQSGEGVDELIGNGWNVSQLEMLLFGTPKHEVHSLNDHSDHFSLGAPDGVLTASTINGRAGRPFEGEVFYSVGCHSGLNVPDSWDAGYHPLDMPQVMLRKGAEVYLGNTGFGWGLRHSVGLGEKLMEGITGKILAGSMSVGECVNKAKRDYYLSNKRYDVYDEKTLFQSTLFGLPMYKLSGIAALKPSMLLSANGPDEQKVDGIVLTKKTQEPGAGFVPPPGVTEVGLRFDFSAAGIYQKIDVPGQGSYYTLNGEASDEAGDAIQPLFKYDSQLSGTVAKGVLFLGGSYTTEEGFNPLVGVPASLNPDLGEGPIGPSSMAFIPTVNVSKVRQTSTAVPMADLMQLTCYTGYYRTEGAKQIESLFQTMDFASYYSNSTDKTPPVLSDPDPDPANPHPDVYGLHTLNGITANFSVGASDASGIYRVLVVYTDYLGEWKSFDLTYNSTSGKWEGSMILTRSIGYHVQLVDNNGNLGYLAKSGYDLDPMMNQYGSSYSTPRMFTITIVDTDSDGMPDDWETAHGTDPNVADAGADPDGDGLTNIQEMANNTNPQDDDTDNDGMKDGWEVSRGLNPLANDSMLDPDKDSLTNLDEYLNDTNPYSADTDGDTMPDGWEVAYSLNPKLDDRNGDGDYDGLNNGQEYVAATNPNVGDTDGDGDNDGSEYHNGRNPNLAGDGKRLTILAEKVGDDVIINWSDLTGENGVIDGPYWIYRAEVPYHGSSDELVTTPLPLENGTTTYTDVGAGGGTQTYFYTVSNSRYLGPAPTIDMCSPSSGPAAGGTTIKIYGENFVNGATVKIGTTPATSVVFVNSTTLQCRTPSGSPGAADVTVTNPNGQFGKKAAGFTYY